MNCLNCHNITLSAPSETFTFGDSFTTGDTYRVYIENTATKQFNFQDIEADADGALEFDMEALDPHFYHPNATYMLWVTEEGALMYDSVDITKGLNEYVCLAIKFNNLVGNTNVLVTTTNQTL